MTNLMKNSDKERSMLVLKGVAASPGVAIGPAVLLPGESFAVTRQYIEPGDVVVLTAGIPSTNIKQEHTTTSNMMRIATVE